MRIWFTEIGEPLPIDPSVRLLRYGLLSRYLAGRGHDISWWTSGFEHQSHRHLVKRDEHWLLEGVRINFIRGLGYSQNISIRRILHQKHFARRLRELIQKEDPPDIVVSSVPTIETAFTCSEYCRMNGVPMVVDIRDEWPDDFERLFPDSLRWIIKFLLRRERRRLKTCLGVANGIIGSSSRQLQYGLSVAERSKGPNDLVIYHPYDDRGTLDSSLDGIRYWERLGVDSSKTIVAFAGTMGKYFNLKIVIEAARVLEAEGFVFVLCGLGSSRKDLQAFASGCDSVIFPGWVDRIKLSSLMRMSSIGIAPYSTKAVTMSMPNKIIEYLSFGLPVVGSLRGEFLDLIERENCGFYYEASSLEQLLEAIRELQMENLKREMAENAQKSYNKHFSLSKTGELFESYLAQLVMNAPHVGMTNTNFDPQ